MDNKRFYYWLLCFVIVIITLSALAISTFKKSYNDETEITNVDTTPVIELIIGTDTIAQQNNNAVHTEPVTEIVHTEPETEIPETEPVTELVTELETEIEHEPLDPYTLTLDQIKNEPYYHDIPLTHEQQDIAMNIAGEYNLPVDLLYAIMCVETHFTVDIISSTNDYGIMQINKNNHEWLNERIGANDFLDYETNVRCGAYVLNVNLSVLKCNDVSKLLMCYNRGYGGTKKAWENGETFDYYCEKVMTELFKLQESR